MDRDRSWGRGRLGRGGGLVVTGVVVVEEDIDSDTQVLEQTRCKFATSRISLEASN